MKSMGRRSFARSIGAAALAAPFVRFAGAPRAHADGAPPLRLVLWPSMNGVNYGDFNSEVPSPTFTYYRTMVEPLKPYASQITHLHNVSMYGNATGTNNHTAVRAMFTGAEVLNYDLPNPTVKSLDQVVCDAFAQSAPSLVPSLHLAVRPAQAIEFYQQVGRSTLFFSPSVVAYEANPVTAFDQVFGSLGGGSSAPPTSGGKSGPDPVKLRNALLGIQAAEIDGLKSQLGKSPVELNRLAQHASALKTLVKDPSATPVATIPITADSTPMDSVESLRAQLEGNAGAAYQDALFGGIYDAQVDIMARALISGVTRVATLQAGWADGDPIVPLDGGYPHHTTSHGDPATFARVQAWYAGKFLRLLKALDVKDPLDPKGKTVLYNSAILWLSECLPNTHSSGRLPCFIAGSAGGRLVSGKELHVTDGTTRSLLKTLANVFGVADADSAHFGSDVISGLTT